MKMDRQNHKRFCGKKPEKLSHDEEDWGCFNFERHKHVLNKMFFSTSEKVKIGSKEHDEFWLFLKKYQKMAQKSAGSDRNKLTRDSADKLPKNLEMPDEWVDVDELMTTKGCIFNDDDEYGRDKLTRPRVVEFRKVAVLYLDFLDRQRAKALEKMRQLQADLPIAQYKDDILAAVSNHSVVLVAGDTGCGKSTQVPQYLLHAGYEHIACTQPRRIACISLRKRVAYETLNEFGTEVGYQIRFDKSKSKHTKILFITEGLLLRQVATDPMLSNYNVIILDEVHERHLSCDFLLGVIKCLILQRSQDLRVILMSATINTEMFSNYFGNCPVIQVPGRLYPIETKYFPLKKEEISMRSSKINPSPYLRILKLINDKFPSSERGDVLVFLSGLTEISTVAETLQAYARQTEKWIILLLHSTLSIDEQDKVFDVPPEGVRKCILSTNIAETSVTIDGIRFVVDSGKVKEMSYDPSCRMQRLQEFWISQASAEQRKGRAGRTGPGTCYRLYSESDFNAFDLFSTAEIMRVPLDSLVLQMISMGLPDARKFPFLESPPKEKIEEVIQSLKEQEALNQDESLTSLGKMLARLPVDITIGKMLILGSVFNLMEPILSLAASLSVQNPITNKSQRDSEMIAARKSLNSDDGDAFTLLNAYNQWLDVKADQNKDSRKWCKRRGLEEQRFYEITKLRRQFKDLMQDAGLLDSSGDIETSRAGSSGDRIKRFGEMIQLKKLKRQHDRSAPKRKKLLKLQNDDDKSEPEDENVIDIRDVEFRLSHDRKQVEALQAASGAYTSRDVALIKLVLCRGLHPQIAIADEHNSYKIDSDQMFHTKNKPFTILHPTCLFASSPELLKLTKIEQVKGFHSSAPLSTKHQLIAYVSLLETTKPYLCNCTRIPAGHILLLVAQLDTNHDFTRIICDDWLELQFASSENAQKFVFQAFRIRDEWMKLLFRVFEEYFEKSDQNNETSHRHPEIRRMQIQLAKDVYKFLKIEILYSIRRLLAADIKNLYVGKQQTVNIAVDKQLLKDCFDDEQCSPNTKKGGLQVKSYLTYSCLTHLEDTSVKYLKKVWTCPYCQQESVATVLEQMRHREKCQFANASKEQDEEEKEDDEDSSKNAGTSGYDPLKNLYFCSDCQTQLLLTATEIIKHKRGHQVKNV